MEFVRSDSTLKRCVLDKLNEEIVNIKGELSQVDAKLDAKLETRFKEFKDELISKRRSELQSYPNLATSNASTSAKGKGNLGASFPIFVLIEPIEVSTRGRVHVRENLFVMDFADKNMANLELIEPPSIEYTPFKLVEEVKDLELAAKLRNVDDFAVDLEHNKYRSLQGITCLMQISTRTKDFIVDTLML
ncbi:hypothetical protein J1N35_021975 [Gossypium stocksii]|uniref:3'-5' exonuclease domain-containing protein n=1 Tax=Gossypium stocksii TaxID=47602 RepID=A0A9D3VGU7_9ROSI|nr:hypothetical protein J1N35_021975 [Gossypium stocksii]